MTPLHEIPAVREALLDRACDLATALHDELYDDGIGGFDSGDLEVQLAIRWLCRDLDTRTRLIAHFLRLGPFAEDPWPVGVSAPRLVHVPQLGPHRWAQTSWTLYWQTAPDFSAPLYQRSWCDREDYQPWIAPYTHQRDALAAAEAILRAVLGEDDDG